MDADELKGIVRRIRTIQAELAEVRGRMGPDGTGDDDTRWMRAQLSSIGENDLSLLERMITAAATGTVDQPPI